MNNHRDISEQIREAQRTARRVTVADVPWLVYELPAHPFDRRTGSSLVFESDQAVRRVRDFPVNWRELGDDDLYALSWSA